MSKKIIPTDPSLGANIKRLNKKPLSIEMNVVLRLGDDKQECKSITTCEWLRENIDAQLMKELMNEVWETVNGFVKKRKKDVIDVKAEDEMASIKRIHNIFHPHRKAINFTTE